MEGSFCGEGGVMTSPSRIIVPHFQVLGSWEPSSPGLVSNWEAQSCAGEEPFGVKPLVGPGAGGI